MAGPSGKDMTVFDFSEETAEMTRNALLRERRNKSPVRADIRITKQDFINCFSRKYNVDHLEASDGLNSEHDSGNHQGETTGRDEEEQMDSLTTYNVGHYLNGASVNAAPNNDDSKPMTSTTSDPSGDVHVDLSSEDEGLSTRKFSTSNAMSDVSDDEGASEHSDSESCHNSDDADNMESEDSAVILCPEFSLFGTVTILMSRLTFTAELIRLEIFDHKSSSDVVNVFQWSLCDVDYVKTYWLSRVCVAVLFVGFKHGSTTELETFFEVPGAQSVLEFALNDPSWPEQEQRILSLSAAYNGIWKSLDGDMHRFEDIVCELHPEKIPSAFQDPYLLRFEETFDEFVFPKGDPDAVTISGRDILLLQPETFINDTLIDFYIKYLQSTLSDKQREACHFFNSFFFRKLADLDKAPDTEVVNRQAFLRVRKWTRRVNLFEKDYIFIPVNYGYHWSLIVICNPGAVFSLEDGNHSETPCILHMDSISGTHANLRKLIQSYLWEEWRERHMENEPMFDAARENFVNMPFISLEVPQQHNYCDCGLFLLHYVEMFLREAPPKFSFSEVQKIANFLSGDWFLPREASTLKRTYIRDLIYKLHKEVSVNGPAPSNVASHQSCEAGQSDVGGSQDQKCVSEDHAPNQSHTENMFLLDKLNQISVSHMDEDTSRILLCDTSKVVAVEDFGKSLGLVCGEHDEIETNSRICHDEQYGSFHQNTLAEQLKSTLSQRLENDNQSTQQMPCASSINNSSDALFQYRTDDPGHTEKESEYLCVLPAVTSNIQLGLLSNPPDLDTSQLLDQGVEHSERSSKQVCCTDGSGLPSTASETSHRVRKLEIFDTCERKKQKSLDGIFDLEADKAASQEIEEPATVMDMKTACETNVFVEPQSNADVLQSDTQLACEDETQVERLNMMCKDLENNLSPKQSLEQEKVGDAVLVSSDNDNNIALDEKNLISSAKQILNFQDAGTLSHCETVTGDLDGSENFNRDSSAPSQADLQSVDHDNEAVFASGDKLKPSSSIEDYGRSDGNSVKNGAIVVDGGECVDSSPKTNGNSNNFADSSGNISQDADELVALKDERAVDDSKCTNAINNANEILDNAVLAEGITESLPYPVDNTSITPEKQKILASEDTVELLSSNHFSSPPPELIMRRTRSQKTPSTIENGGDMNGGKGVQRILERPRTRSVTKSMDSVKLARESRRKSISKK